MVEPQGSRWLSCADPIASDEVKTGSGREFLYFLSFFFFFQILHREGVTGKIPRDALFVFFGGGGRPKGHWSLFLCVLLVFLEFWTRDGVWIIGSRKNSLRV